MRSLVFFLGLVCSVTALGQDVTTILTKVNNTYSGKNIQYNTLYELFKGHKSKEVYSSYSGKVLSHDGNVYQKIDKTEFIYTQKFSVKISSNERTMVVLPGQRNENPELDLELALRDCASSEVIDKGSFYRLVLKIKPTSSLQCSMINVDVEKAKFVLKQIDIYYSFLQDFSQTLGKQDLKQPHLRIKFSNVNLNASAKSELFSQATYFSIVNSALKAADKYASYTIYDNR